MANRRHVYVFMMRGKNFRQFVSLLLQKHFLKLWQQGDLTTWASGGEWDGDGGMQEDGVSDEAGVQGNESANRSHG
jgi:hypothetical protein